MATFIAPDNWAEVFIDGEDFYMDMDNDYKLYNLDGTEVKHIVKLRPGVYGAPDMDISSIAAEEEEEDEEEEEEEQEEKEEDEEEEDEDFVYDNKTCSSCSSSDNPCVILQKSYQEKPTEYICCDCSPICWKCEGNFLWDDCSCAIKCEKCEEYIDSFCEHTCISKN
jgi:hypothetical protein